MLGTTFLLRVCDVLPALSEQLVRNWWRWLNNAHLGLSSVRLDFYGAVKDQLGKQSFSASNNNSS